MRMWQEARVIRWTLLSWFGLLYLWGLLYVNVRVDVPTPTFEPAATLLFTLLMGLHASLYVYRPRLTGPPLRWPFALYAGAQSGLVLLINLIAVHTLVLPVGLSLALIAEAIITLPPRRRVKVVVVYGVLCLLIVALTGRNVLTGAVSYLLLILPLTPCVVAYVVLYQQQVDGRKRTQALLHDLEAAHAALAAYADRVEDLTLLTERQRMARELHDTLAQGLAGVILQLEAVRLRLASGEADRASEIIDQAQARARAALAAARQAIDDLRAGPAGAGDAHATVEEEIRRFSTATGIAVEADIAALATLPADVAEQTVRVIVEGLTNVLRHAQAQRIWVQVMAHEGGVETVVRDDGVGFDVTAAAGMAGHYGLLGLRERARLAGGEVQVVSEPGQGTTVRLCLPCLPRLLDEAAPVPAAPLGSHA